MSTVDEDDNLQEQRDEILALQSIYDTDDDKKVKIISEVDTRGHGVYSFVLSVTVKPVGERIQVKVAVPNEDAEEEVLGAAATGENQTEAPVLSSDVKVQMNRSLSGRQWEGSFEVKYLTPILLYVTFPKSYPSHNPPQYHIASSWMTPIHVHSLSVILNQLWADGSYMPIVFTWADWLENAVIEHLGITEFLTLHDNSVKRSNEEFSVGDTIPWEEEIGNVIASLVQYNRQQSDIEFCQNQHVCEICYDEKPGTQFFLLRECDHKFCCECLAAFCEMHVTAGTVEELRCPDTECNIILPPYIVQGVLGPDAYDRWEKLLLQKTLDAMNDTTYCPRCQSLVIREEEEDMHLAMCVVCNFAFCTECQQGWHQGSACETAEHQLQAAETKMAKMSTAEQTKYREIVQRLTDEALSKTLRGKTCRNCPSCKVPVEKNGGCNKMTCKCGKSFCWQCGQSINGYDHFKKCVLFPGQVTPAAVQIRLPPEALLRMRARLDLNPELKNRQTRCPMCKQDNLKGDNNNHIKCWNCKTNFCYQCNGRIAGTVTDHFKGPCTQHSQ